MRWWPRSIRWQMLFSLVLLEALSIAAFALILMHLQQRDVRARVRERLAHQATSLAMEAEEAYMQQRPDWAGLSVRMMGDAPSVLHAKITDRDGKTIFASAGEPSHLPLEPAERAQIAKIKDHAPVLFSVGKNQSESVKPIFVGPELRGYAFVQSDPLWDSGQLFGTLRATLIFGTVWILASIMLVWLMSRLISKPLAILHRGTRSLVSMPESSENFPLPVTTHSEFGDLIEAFNRMVAALQEQRAGLHDTLSLLDSMLANAPVGLAFFDKHFRFVRVNQVFADLTGIPLSRHLGRTLHELVPPTVATQLEQALQRVFSTEEKESELELSGEDPSARRPWTWLVSVYPVRTSPNQVRWAGVIVRDVSERARAEEALRKTEKLAATGRLAASIAHEINNPLEALTNLMFLMRNFSSLNPQALQYLDLAEQEVRRIAEIAQQTLRFYRQSTLPLRANMVELVDSVLDLYKSRLNSLNVEVVREYDPQLTLFCFSGEIRQVFANLVGNAVDAMPNGGRLIIRAHRSHNWRSVAPPGVRFTVVDTGAGMDRQVSERIFEAFFTTKEDTGTGLGLWVSHEIVLKHRGIIRVRSRAAQAGKFCGTIFQIFLPDDETLTQLVRHIPS